MARNWFALFVDRYPLPWQMRPAERLALIALVQAIRPDVAIEIGSADGGSLQVIADHAKRVYALDNDPTTPTRLAQFPNVEFRIGLSGATFPALLAELHAARKGYQFVLIDGNHTEEFVRTDVQGLLSVPPLTRAYVLLHDSFNPECRRAIRTAGWESSPFVHSVDLDFVQGWFHGDETPIPKQMWAGFALAILDPQPRTEPLRIRESQLETFQRMYEVSAHR
jgi:hypothetical protein